MARIAAQVIEHEHVARAGLGAHRRRCTSSWPRRSSKSSPRCSALASGVAVVEGVAQEIEHELAQVEGVVITSKMSPPRSSPPGCASSPAAVSSALRSGVAVVIEQEQIEQELAQVEGVVIIGRGELGAALGRGRGHHLEDVAAQVIAARVRIVAGGRFESVAQEIERIVAARVRIVAGARP